MSHPHPPLCQPPFPTRRSSDLSAARRLRVRATGLTRRERGEHAGVPRARQERAGEEGRREKRSAHTGSAGVTGASRDRKSTRLNSSHLVISYAVFCLKKKRGHK